MIHNHITVPNMELILKTIVNQEKDQFKKFHNECNIVADTVFKAISQHEGVNAARWLIAGSIGKRTSVGIHHDSLPDFDLVILLNQDIEDEDNPFGDTVEIVSEIVKGISEDFKLIRAHRCTIQCKYNSTVGEVKFDIVLGFNFLTNPTPESDHERVQLEKVLKLVAEDPLCEKNYLSSSLAEAAVNFVEKQPPFVHDIILLAKLWNKMRIPAERVGYISGRSSIIELMAIQAANSEIQLRGPENVTYLGAFTSFLSMFDQRRKRLRVVFPLGINPNHPAYAKYQQMTSKRGGIVLDPVNPYNNLLDGLLGLNWTAFNGQARMCLNFCSIHNNKLEECFKPPAPRSRKTKQKRRARSQRPQLFPLFRVLSHPSYM